MDYKGIEALVEEYKPILDIIDEKALLWHFIFRRLRLAEESNDKRNYHACLADMQAPLCLASVIETEIQYSQEDGYIVSRVTTRERYEDMILKGETKEGANCELFHDSSKGDIVLLVDGEGTKRHSISDYQKELFKKPRDLAKELVDGLSALASRVRSKTKSL